MSASVTSQRRVIITGATGSLGQRLVSKFSDDGWAVTALCRSKASLDVAHDRLSVEEIDLSQDDAPERLLGVFRSREPELIVHTAVTYDEEDANTNMQGTEAIHRINAFSVFEALWSHIDTWDPNTPLACIMVNSDGIYHTTPRTCRYAASKAALRVLTTGLAQKAKGSNTAISTLLLGPLADRRKSELIERVAQTRGVEPATLEAQFLQRTNPFLAVERFISLDACYQSVRYMHSLGPQANGMVCRLDGGSSGALL